MTILRQSRRYPTNPTSPRRMNTSRFVSQFSVCTVMTSQLFDGSKRFYKNTKFRQRSRLDERHFQSKSQIILSNTHRIPCWFKEAGCKTGKILSLKSHHNYWRLVKVQSRKMHEPGLPSCPQMFMQLPPRFCFSVTQWATL